MNQRSQQKTSFASSMPLEIPAEDPDEDFEDYGNDDKVIYDLNRNRRSETYTSQYSSAINPVAYPYIT